MKQLGFLLLLTACYLELFSQTELVPNNGFETIITCPVGFSQFEDFVDVWINPNTASPDYMNACANPFPAGVPENGTGFQSPHGGEAYAGIYTFSGTFYREFIQVNLLSPLTAGVEYTFSMYVVLHNKSNTAIDDLGVYFSSVPPTSAGTGMLAGAPLPQISNPFGSVLMDTINWTLISGTYTATGGEQYITIGHLKSDAATTYLPVPFGSQGAYYYIDDVSLKEIEILPVSLASFNAEIIAENQPSPFTQITWATQTEVNNCCFYVQRSTDGLNFSDIGIVDGEGNSTSTINYLFYDPHPVAGINYYRLLQKDVDGHISASDIISVMNAAGNNLITFYQGDDLLYIVNKRDDILKAGIYDMEGRQTQQFMVKNGTSVVSLSENNIPGIYLLLIADPQTGSNLLSEKIYIR